MSKDGKPIAHISTQPAYAAAAKERHDLAVALGRVNARIDEIDALLRVNITAEDRESSHVAAALHFAQTGEVKVSDRPNALHDEHQVLRQQRDALEKAMRARNEALNDITGELSAAMGRELEERHRKLAGRYVQALKQLDALHEEEISLVSEIQSAGYSPRFRAYIQWPLVGRLANRGESSLWNHLNSLNYYAAE